MVQTLRITKTTFSSEHVAPDGSHRFGEGLVVAVRDGAQTVDEATARRWLRNGFAEEYDGEEGTVVASETRGASEAELVSRIQSLQAELAQRQGAAGRAGAAVGYVGRAAAPLGEGAPAPEPVSEPGTPKVPRDAFGAQADRPGYAVAAAARVPEDRPTAAAYQDPTGPHPLARYDFLTDQQRASLTKAGFSRPEHFANAADADITAVEGVGEGTLRRIREADRGRRP